MYVAAIIPVKRFSKAKTRLGLDQEKTERLCSLMLDEVLATISKSKKISRTILVSKDETALEIGKRHNAVQITEQNESGVNAAVSLPEKFLLENGFESSVVFPQDIPLMQPEDIDSLLGFQRFAKSLLVVPSRKFDGTNALVRSPIDVMETHYDEDSYRIHLTTAKNRGIRSSFVLIPRIMLDVDDISDLNYIVNSSEKPELTNQIRQILT